MELGRDWLKIIFSNGLAGIKPCIPVSFELLQLEASKKLSKNAFDYIFTGAGTNQGVTNNRESFKRYRIKPHMLQGCENPSLETQIFNNRFPLPFYFSPIGVLELAHLNADLELAIAAKNTGRLLTDFVGVLCLLEFINLLNTGSDVYCAKPLPYIKGRYAFSKSITLQPMVVVSNVRTKAVHPFCSALETKLSTSSLDLLKYN